MKALKFNKHHIFAISGLVVLLFVGLVMPASVLAAPPQSTMQTGIDPNHPIALSISAGQDMPETGTLAPGQKVWYAVTVNDANGAYFENQDNNQANYDRDANQTEKSIGDEDQAQNNDPTDRGLDQPPFDLSLFVTPGNGNSIDNIQMDLFPDSYARQWSAGNIYVPTQDNSDALAPFGTATVVTRDDKFQGDPNVGELTYSGDVISGQTVLVEIENGNAFPVTYHLFTAHMDNVTL